MQIRLWRATRKTEDFRNSGVPGDSEKHAVRKKKRRWGPRKMAPFPSLPTGGGNARELSNRLFGCAAKWLRVFRTAFTVQRGKTWPLSHIFASKTIKGQYQLWKLLKFLGPKRGNSHELCSKTQFSEFKCAKHGPCRINSRAKRLKGNNSRESCQNLRPRRGTHMNYAAKGTSGSASAQNMAPVT